MAKDRFCFRAWCDGKMHYGISVCDGKALSKAGQVLKNAILMQRAGIADREKVVVWEGDCIRLDREHSHLGSGRNRYTVEEIWEVKWNADLQHLELQKEFISDSVTCAKRGFVIGNLYENAEHCQKTQKQLEDVANERRERVAVQAESGRSHFRDD